MICPFCGRAAPGEAARCPDCGRAVGASAAEAPRGGGPSAGFGRLLFYPAFGLGLFILLTALRSSLQDAENERTEAGLRRQRLERRLQEMEREPGGDGGEGLEG